VEGPENNMVFTNWCSMKLHLFCSGLHSTQLVFLCTFA